MKWCWQRCELQGHFTTDKKRQRTANKETFFLLQTLRDILMATFAKQQADKHSHATSNTLALVNEQLCKTNSCSSVILKAAAIGCTAAA